jgi:hypothetical protein
MAIACTDILPILKPIVNKISPCAFTHGHKLLFSVKFDSFGDKPLVEATQLLFVVAKMLAAVCAGETFIAFLKVALGA